MAYDIITILGPTACGKTKLATHLCYSIEGEIISADSRQVYKKMNIGTGKDLTEYTINNKKIPYHLIDIVEPGEKYHVFRYKQDFYAAYEKVKRNQSIPVLCGGSGMYIEAIIRNYNLVEVPENPLLRKELEGLTLEQLTQKLSQYKKLHNKTDIDTKKRAIRAIEIEEYSKQRTIKNNIYPSLNSLTIGLELDKEIRRQRISQRLKQRLDEGMIDEVQHLLQQGIHPEDLIYYGLEYKYITEYLLGYYSFETFFTKLETAIFQFAKRQMTYFRGMQRRGITIHWLNACDDLQENVSKIIKLYQE